MSFSIVSALVLLMTLGQIFLKDGDFKRHFAPHEVREAVDLLRKSCRMIMDEEEIKALSPDTLMTIVKQGIARQETLVEKQVDAYCEKQSLEFKKLNGPDEIAPSCDRAEALVAIQDSLPKMASPLSEPLQIFSEFDIKDAVQLYDFLCSPEPVDLPPTRVSMPQVLELYNKTMSEALSVDLNAFNQPILPQSSLIYSADGREILGEVFGKEGRRSWVPLTRIPDVVKQAFISAEDKNFHHHNGVELRGVLRGFIRYIKDKEVVGGSTLTQQVVKNIVLSNEVTLERKVKEMVIANRLEKLVNKEKILEIYLNLINLGRNSWGIQTATENYFGDSKSVSELGLNEASFLAGVTHSPNSYEPEFQMEKIIERQQFVLREMKENGYVSEEDLQKVDPTSLPFIERKVLQSSYFHRAVEEDIKRRLDPVDAEQGGLFLFSTQIPAIQKAMEKALQEKLYQYELSHGKIKWTGPLGNMIKKDPQDMDIFEIASFHDQNFWLERLERFKALYQDVHWPVAVVLDINRDQILIGLKNSAGEAITTELYQNYKTRWGKEAIGSLRMGDVIFVGENKKNYALRVPPTVQGAAIAMEAKTGRVIALTGGFSFHQSELNRAIHSYRQPGSSVKPFTYLAALNQGLQPDQVLPNASIRLDPIYLPGERKIRRFMKCNAWSVRNYSNSGPSHMTMRRALETSSNRVTAHLLKAIWPSDPEMSLNYIREIFMDFGIYEKPQECYPVILGSDETNLLKLAAAYAAIANGGTLVEPHFLDEKRNAGLLKLIPQQKRIFSVDEISLFQVKNILSGAVTRGTGTALKSFSGKVAGKTGTSTSHNDAWFMGFSNDLVVGVWMGYDNGSGEKAVLKGGTGGGLAAPVAKEIFEEAFKYYPPSSILDNPPAGMSLYDVGGYIESFRGNSYSGVRYDIQPETPRISDSEWNDRGFYFDDDLNYEDPDEIEVRNYERNPQSRERRRQISPEADRAIREGSGGLY